MFWFLAFQLLCLLCYVSTYDIGLCKEYYNKGSERGDTTPISIPFDYLKNNSPRGNEIFRGNFLINPSDFGKNWISFKPIGTYSKGQEYQIAFDTENIEVGLVDDVRFKEPLEIGDSWVAIKIVIKFDGTIEVYVDDDKQSPPFIFQLPEIYNNKPLFLEFKGPNHQKYEIIVFYDCSYFDRRRTSEYNNSTGSSGRIGGKSSRDPSYRGDQNGRDNLRDPHENRENSRDPYENRGDPRGPFPIFSNGGNASRRPYYPQQNRKQNPTPYIIGGERRPVTPYPRPDAITNTDGYNAGNCENYYFKGTGENKPVSFPLNRLRNNKANQNDIFRGSFIVNPEKYGTVWISFKPVGEYAKDEEYQVVFYPELVSIGTIGASKARLDFPEKLKGWVSTEISVRSDGFAEVYIDGAQEPLRYRLEDIVRNRPNFLELKGPNSDSGEFSAFFDCNSFERKENQSGSERNSRYSQISSRDFRG